MQISVVKRALASFFFVFFPFFLASGVDGDGRAEEERKERSDTRCKRDGQWDQLQKKTRPRSQQRNGSKK